MGGNILLVEDDVSQRMVISQLLEKNLGYRVKEAGNGKEALYRLKDNVNNQIDLIIMDLQMPEMGGLETLEILKQKYSNIPVLVLTGSDDIDDAVRAMKLGAVDFINKPPSPEHFGVSIHNALKISALTTEVSRLKRKDEGNTLFSDLIGYDNGLADVVSIGTKAASSDIPVLITGETGVGKELFARSIHGESIRVGRPFVAVNCGAIPEKLVESTLFGHEKGAFTGAISKAIGKFREAEGGTIFLDEVGELPPEAQVKLLRVLQQKEVEPVGSSKTVPTNIRVISATNRNLAEEVKKGRFREDLFFRLEVLPILIPPLKARKDDISLLVKHFIERFEASEGLPLKAISEDAIQMLESRNWPGNIRELENLIHRAIVISENDTLQPEDFEGLLAPNHSANDNRNRSGSYNNSNLDFFTVSGSLKTIDEIEQDAMQHALDYHNGNTTRAAKSLGIAKSTFYRKLKRE